MTQEDQDYFGDADLADPKNLPVGQKYIGRISTVKTEESEQGNFKQFAAGKLKNGRTEVPIITVVIRALKFADGREFPEDENYMQTSNMDFWVGKEDKVGRHSLANLICGVCGFDKESLRTMRMQDAAKQMVGGFVAFIGGERKFTRGDGSAGTVMVFQNVKAASEEEKALVA